MTKLFLGINNHVVCLNKQDGAELWKTKLRSSTITNVYFDNDCVFAYSGGHLFCLDTQNGEIIWENQLRGLGYGTCIIASEHQSSAVIANQVAAQQAGAAASSVAVTGAAASSS